MDEKEAWSVSDIIDNRNNWSLAGDAELLKHLLRLSKKLFDKSQSTLTLLKSFENDVNQTCICVANINNHFGALSDTQFVESKVEDSPEMEIETAKVNDKETKNPQNEDITMKLKEALDNGMNVLDRNYDIIAVTDSDSESEEAQEVLLKARNPYMNRRLPYIIGSDNFTNYDHLGLVDTSSEEEEEEDEEESEEEIIKQPLPTELPISQETSQPSIEAHVLRVSSSDSEDSDVPFSQKDYSKSNEDCKPNVEKSAVNATKLPLRPPAETPNSFAEHLNATLQNYGVSRRGDIGSHADIFSPPPFPAKETNYSSSDDEKSDSSNDIFHSNVTIRKSVPDHNTVKSEIIDVCDDYSKIVAPSVHEDLFCKESLSTRAVIPKTCRSSKVPAPSKSFDLHGTSDESTILPSTRNDKNRRVISAVNAELSSKLRIETRRESSEEEREDDLTSKSGVSSHPPSSSNHSLPFISTSKTINVLEDEEPNIFDICASGKLAAEEGEATQRSNNFYRDLFDDDDDELDLLFKPTTTITEIEDFQTSTHSLYDYNLETEPIVEKVKDVGLPGGVSSVFGRKLALFDSDSDSEDEILAIINSQNRKTVDTETESCMKEPSSGECSSTQGMKEPQIVVEQNQIFDDNKNVKFVVDCKLKQETCKMMINAKQEIVESEIGDSAVDPETKNCHVNESREIVDCNAANSDSTVVTDKLDGFKFEKVAQGGTNIIVTSPASKRNVFVIDVPETLLSEQSTAAQRSTQSFDNYKEPYTLSPEKNVCEQYDDGRDRRSTAEEETPVLPKRKPGKLTAARGLNINVNALLPGSNWSTITKQQKESAIANPEGTEDDDLAEVSSKLHNEIQLMPNVNSAPSVSNLSNVIKERVKILNKRRPPSRRTRINNIAHDVALLKDDIDSQNEADNFTEVPKTLTNGTEQVSQTHLGKPEPKLAGSSNEEETFDDTFSRKDEKKRTTVINDLFANSDEEPINSFLSVDEDKIIRGGDNDLESHRTISNKVSDIPNTVDFKKREIETTVSNNTSASVLTGFIKDRAKLPKKRPPTRRLLKKSEEVVVESIIQEDIRTNVPHSSDPVMEGLSNEESEKISSSAVEDIFETQQPKRSRSPGSEKIRKLFEGSDDDDVDLIADLLASSKKKLETSAKASVFIDSDKVEEMTVKTEKVVSKSSTKELHSTDLFGKSFFNKPDQVDLFSSGEVEIASKLSSKKTEENFFNDCLMPNPVAKSVFGGHNLFDDDDGDIFVKSTPKVQVSNLVLKSSNEDENKLASTAEVSKSSSNLSSDESKIETNMQPGVYTLDKFNGNDGSNVDAEKVFIKAKVANEPKKKGIDLFSDNDDELFSKSSKLLSKTMFSTKSFLFEADDDDDLFGKNNSVNVGKSSDIKKKPNLVSNVEKGRIVKLRSESVIENPLTEK